MGKIENQRFSKEFYFRLRLWPPVRVCLGCIVYLSAAILIESVEFSGNQLVFNFFLCFPVVFQLFQGVSSFPMSLGHRPSLTRAAGRWWVGVSCRNLNRKCRILLKTIGFLSFPMFSSGFPIITGGVQFPNVSGPRWWRPRPPHHHRLSEGAMAQKHRKT